MFDSISEISFLCAPEVASVKVGGLIDGHRITKIVPRFNCDGALIAVKVIGTAEQLLSTITVYGVPCSIKTN